MTQPNGHPLLSNPAGARAGSGCARLLNTCEAALRLRLASGTLQNWRSQGQGPAFVRLGRAVRYDETDLARFVEKGRLEADMGPVRLQGLKEGGER